MAGIKPDQLDYGKIVDRMDEQNFDWGALAGSIEDPGFGELSPEHQRHIMDLLTVKDAKNKGVEADPNAPSGKHGALRQIGNIIKALGAAVGGPGLGGQPGTGYGAIGEAFSSQDKAVADLVRRGNTKAQAEQINTEQLAGVADDVMKQFGHYVSGGIIDEPAESKDPYVRQIMDGIVKPVTGLAAVGTQIVGGLGIIGLVSKVPIISAAAANLSAVTRGLISGAALDFGISAAWPEGLPKENRLGVSDNIARMLAPESVMDDPKGLQARLLMGVGGMVEGAILGGAMFGMSYGWKVAAEKQAWNITPKQFERVKESLKAYGVDVEGMTKKDAMMTYRTRMGDHVQGMAEAAFNGERLSAEEWIAHAFLADPNVTELTPAEGQLLWGVFSNNKGGVSVIRNISDPEAALSKLSRAGINVDATIIPRRTPGVVGSDVRPVVSDEELDRAVELAPDIGPKPEGEPVATPAKRRKTPTKKDLQDQLVSAERRASVAERKAQYDGLTGVHNQSAWKDAQPRLDADENIEIVSIDLQGFKDVNNKIGHAAGDVVLQKTAAALQGSIGGLPGAQVFRVGGDEFVLAVPKGTGKDALNKAQEALLQMLPDDIHIKPTMRGGVGATYKDADAAERSLREATNGVPTLAEFAKDAEAKAKSAKYKGYIRSTAERFGKPGEGLYTTEEKVREDIAIYVHDDIAEQEARQVGINVDLFTKPPSTPGDPIFKPKVVDLLNKLGDHMKQTLGKRSDALNLANNQVRDGLVTQIGEEIGHEELTNYLNKIPSGYAGGMGSGVDDWLYHAWRETRPEVEIKLESAESFLRYLEDLSSGRDLEGEMYSIDTGLLGGTNAEEIIQKIGELGEDNFQVAMRSSEIQTLIEGYRKDVAEIEKIAGKSPQLKPGTRYGPEPS